MILPGSLVCVALNNLKIRAQGWDPINWFIPPQFEACPKPRPGLPKSNVVVK